MSIGALAKLRYRRVPTGSQGGVQRRLAAASSLPHHEQRKSGGHFTQCLECYIIIVLELLARVLSGTQSRLKLTEKTNNYRVNNNNAFRLSNDPLSKTHRPPTTGVKNTPPPGCKKKVPVQLQTPDATPALRTYVPVLQLMTVISSGIRRLETVT